MLICPFCDTEVKSFHRRSHLLPEWMYKDCYDENHKMANLNSSDNTLSKAQKGMYASIICPECEDETQKYDRYASLILTDRSPKSPEYLAVKKSYYHEIPYDGTLYKLSRWGNFDFLKFQKFVFVTVLRSHLAEKQNGSPLLIDKHFKKMLSIYKQHGILDDETYPIQVMKFPEEDIFPPHVIPLRSYRNKEDGHRIVEFSGGGYCFRVF